MLQLVDKSETAKRKPYKYSDEVSARMRKDRKLKEVKRKNLAKSIIRVDSLTEIVEDIDDVGGCKLLDSY